MKSRRRLPIIFCILLAPIVFGSTVQASEDIGQTDIMEGFESHEEASPAETESDMDELMGGFEDDVETSEPPEDSSAKTQLSIDGHAKISAAYNFAHDTPETNETDWREISKLRNELYLELNTKLFANWRSKISGKGFYDFLYTLRDRDDFTDEVADNYDKELELTETYVAGSLLKNIDIKIGRQIVVWGKSDNIRITDVLNPLDLREPGLTDIEDLRLPVTMTRLDAYYGDWNLGAFLIHETRYNKNPEFGSDFYPADTPPPEKEDPEEGFYETEYALALNGIFSGWDLSFYYANILNDAYHLELLSVFPVFETRLKHSRLDFYGAAFNLAYGNWLFKTEAAYLDGYQFFNTGDETFSRTDLLIGFDYSGFSDTTLTLELANRHLNDFDDRLDEYPDETLEDDTQSAFRLTRTFLNETLELTLLAIVYGEKGQDGGLERLSLDYDITDALMVRLGAVLYEGGDRSITREIEDNDRVFAEIKYSF